MIYKERISKDRWENSKSLFLSWKYFISFFSDLKQAFDCISLTF